MLQGLTYSVKEKGLVTGETGWWDLIRLLEGVRQVLRPARTSVSGTVSSYCFRNRSGNKRVFLCLEKFR